MSLGGPLFRDTLLRLDIAFVVMAAVLVILSAARRLSPEARRTLWLKLGVYYVVVHVFLILMWVGGWWLRSALALIALIACREMLATQAGPERAKPYEVVAYAATAALVLSTARPEVALGILVLTLLALLSLPVFLREPGHARARIASALLGVFVAGGLTWILAVLRETHPAAAVFLYLIVVLGDAFTQVGGLLFGRRPWFPTISPKKTLEGTAGGLLACVCGAAAFRMLLRVPFAWAAALGVLIAVCGNLGDLAFSALKRSAGLKDFGRVLPAHGGVLDRFDSLLFTGPVFYAAVRVLGL